MNNGGMFFFGGGDPATMMVGMAMGSFIGDYMARTMNNVMYQNRHFMTPIQAETFYHVVVNGQSTGPFNMNALRQMKQSGLLTPQSFVWKQGMANWSNAADINELKVLFES